MKLYQMFCNHNLLYIETSFKKDKTENRILCERCEKLIVPTGDFEKLKELFSAKEALK